MEKVELSPLIELGNVDSVRNLTIQILSQEWPLNVRKLHCKVEQRRPGVSYHAVHKAVHQLVVEGVVKREDAGYSINVSWAERALTLLSSMKGNEGGSPLYLPGLADFKDGDSKTFYFDTLADADKYRKRLQLEYAGAKSQKPYVVTVSHARSALLYSEKTLAFPTVPLHKVQSYYLISGKTVPDEWCADYYRMQGAFAKTGVDCAHNCDTRVVGDVIEQLYIPEDTLRMMTDLFSSLKHIAHLNVPEFYQNICLRKSHVKFIVMHNRELAEQIRQQVLTHFDIRKVAVLDLDGTFVDPMFPIEATKWLVSKGVINGGAGAELVKLCDKHTSGKMPRDVFVLEYLKLYSKAIKNVSVEDLQTSIRNFVETEGRHLILKHTERCINLMKSHRKLVAITRLPLEFAKAIGYNFSDILATTFEVANGKFTGKISQNMCTVGAKETAFKEWISSKSGIDMDGSIGIGDRFHDLAFMNKVTFPISVNPDAQFAATAKRKGWAIVDGSCESLLAEIKKVL